MKVGGIAQCSGAVEAGGHGGGSALKAVDVACYCDSPALEYCSVVHLCVELVGCLFDWCRTRKPPTNDSRCTCSHRGAHRPAAHCCLEIGEIPLTGLRPRFSGQLACLGLSLGLRPSARCCGWTPKLILSQKNNDQVEFCFLFFVFSFV